MLKLNFISFAIVLLMVIVHTSVASAQEVNSPKALLIAQNYSMESNKPVKRKVNFKNENFTPQEQACLDSYELKTQGSIALVDLNKDQKKECFVIPQAALIGGDWAYTFYHGASNRALHIKDSSYKEIASILQQNMDVFLLDSYTNGYIDLLVGDRLLKFDGRIYK